MSGLTTTFQWILQTCISFLYNEMLPLNTEVNSCARAQNVKQYKKKYEKRQWWLCFFSYKDDQKEREMKNVSKNIWRVNPQRKVPMAK